MTLTLTALLDTAPEALFVLDGEGRVVSCNRPARELFGLGDDVVGRRVVDVAVPERLRGWTAGHLASVLGDDPARVRGRHSGFIGRRADGAEFPAEARIDRIADEPVRFSAWLRDVSATAGPDRPLLLDAERVAAVGHWSWDARTGLATWSPAVFDLLGLDRTSDPASTEAFAAMLHPADRPEVEPHLRSGHDSDLSFRVVRPDGQVRSVVMTRRVELADGVLVRVNGLMRDVTPERQAEALWAAHRAMHDVLIAWEGFAEGIGALLARLGTAMGWVAGGLWVQEADGTLGCRSFWSRPGDELEEYERLSRGLRLPPGQGLVTEAFLGRTLVAVEDVTAMERFARREAAERAGLRSAIALPAVHEGQVLAVLELYAPEPRTVDDTARTALTLIGEQLGAFLHRRRGELRPGALTPREVEVLQLAAQGNGVSEIAEVLVLSTGTVRTHFKNIYDRLGVRDRAAAVAEAMRLGLVS